MCLFCKVVAKQIPAKVLFEDEDVVAFHDINPVAPTHVLVIPKAHVASLSDAKPEHAALLGTLMLACARAAEMQGLPAGGYRVVTNTGPNAGQSVHHLHLHVIGGRPMSWPPG